MMRRVLLLLALLALPLSARAVTCTSTPQPVGPFTVCGTAKYNANSGTNNNSVSISPQAGNSVLVIANYQPMTATVASVTDQSNNSLSCTATDGSPIQLPAQTASNGTDTEGFYICLARSVGSGITAVKMTISTTSNFFDLLAVELDSSAIASSSFWDAESSAASTVEQMSSSTTIASATRHDLMVTWQHNGWPTFPPPGGIWPPVTGDASWTTINGNYDSNNILQMKWMESAATLRPTVTWGTNNMAWFAWAAGLKAVAGNQPAVGAQSARGGQSAASLQTSRAAQIPR